VNDILLGPLERPALAWLAARAPAWVTPDTCTVIGVIGAFGIMVSYALSRIDPAFLWLASLGFVINWLGDSLDGTLARHRHVERPAYGFFVDHTADAANETMMFLGLGMTPYVRFDVACLALSAYLLLSVLVFARTCAVGEFRISYTKIGPTELRVLAILFNAAVYFGGPREMSLPLGDIGQLTFSPYDLVVAGLAVLLLCLFLVTAIQESISLARADE
jgi:phosphatidylglycerophosphate synthase